MTIRRSVLGAAALLVTATALMAHTYVPTHKTNVHGVGWYSSFSDALVEAKQTHRPILLLSMFGKLDEDMPCANARTLRATLFADPQFKALVSSDVIPAWEMVRPVPHVTFDLGDGKPITRTVRGNAVMYLCNSEGRVVDAYPGIYTAKDFLPAIRESISALANADPATVQKFHQDRGHMIPVTLSTITKAVMESPTLVMVGAPTFQPSFAHQGPVNLARQKFFAAAKNLTDLSLTPMTPEEAVAKITGGANTGLTHEELVDQVLANDSATNMERVRPVVHLWMATQTQLPTPEEARDTVLQTILKIPFKDPYFGLKDVIMPGTPP